MSYKLWQLVKELGERTISQVTCPRKADFFEMNLYFINESIVFDWLITLDRSIIFD